MADVNLTALYSQNRQNADRDELLRYMAEPPPPEPLGPPSPTAEQKGKPEEKPGALATIGKTVKDTFLEGASNFVAGLQNRPKGLTDFEGHGQQLLGVMQMLSALPAGAGQAFKQALIAAKPGAENEVAIKGGEAGTTTTAGIIRSILGAPIAMTLDPKLKAAIAKDPIPFAEALNADITYGELADIVGQFVGVPLAGKALGRVVGRGRGGPGEASPTPVTGEIVEPGSPAALPERAGGPYAQAESGFFRSAESLPQRPQPGAVRQPLALPERATPPSPEPLVTPPPELSSSFETRLRAAAAQGPEAYGRAVAEELHNALEQAPPRFADVLREKYGATEAPTPAAVPEGPPIAGGSLPAAMEQGLKRSEQAIGETLGEAFARVRERRMAKEKSAAEPVAPAPAEEPAPAKPTNPLADLSREEIDSVMGSLDLMHTELKHAAPGERHLVTDEMGKVEGGLRQPSTYPDFMEAVGLKKTRANADKLMKVIDEIQAGKTEGDLHGRLIQYAKDHWEDWAGHFGFGGEGGAVDAGLLARMALGAAAGGTQGDTPEERIRNAFLGMGLGAALSKSLAVKVRDAYKASGLADESGALNFDKWRAKPAVQASEQPFQPNYQRIDATPEVKVLMKNLHRMMKDDILERRGPARSNDLRVREATELIQSGKLTPERLLTLGDKEMLTDSEITAARMLSLRAAQHAVETRAKVLEGDPTVPEGSLRQALAVAGAMGRNTRVAQTRIAQAQQSGAIRIAGEGTGYRPQDVAHLADEIMPGMSDQQIAGVMAGLRTAEQVEKVSAWLTLFPRALLQGVYASYLSGKAAGRNIVGNLTMMADAPVQTGIGQFMPRWGSPKPGIVPGEATQMVRTLGESLVNQLRMVKHLDEMEAAARKAGVDISVAKSERREPAGRAFLEDLGVENQRLLKLGEWWDNVTTFPGKVLDRTDVASKTVNAEMARAQESMRQATLEGRTGDAFEARYRELMDDPTQLNGAARDRITRFADTQTFTNELEGRITRALAAGPENEWGNLVYRSFVMPFFRVTANMIDQTFARLPGLNAVSKQFWRDWNAGGAQRQIAQARVVSGAAALGAFMYLESQGVVTGNKPKDPKLAAIWEKAGYPERSWWDAVSQKWRSYDGLGPYTQIIAGAADTSATVRRLPETGAAQVFGAYLMSQINSLDSRTFTQGLSNIMDVITTKSDDTQVEKALDLVRKQVTGLAKPGALREIESFVDPERRPVKRSGAYPEGSLQQEFQTMLDDIWSTMPGFSSAKDAEGNFLYPPSRDRVTGKPDIVESWPFNPFPGQSLKDIEVTMADGRKTGIYAELKRLNGAGLDGWPEWLGAGGRPQADYGMAPVSARKAAVRLTNQERDRYAELWTQVVKDEEGRSYADALKAEMQSRDYLEASDGQVGTDGGKAAALQRVDRKFAAATRELLFQEARSVRGEPGALERELLTKQAEAGIQKVPTAQQPEIRSILENALKNLRDLPTTLSR